jgi:hypothetical protein
MKRMTLFTIGLCVLNAGFIASGVEPEEQQATTIRQLRAEVKMLKATVASLQAEVAKLKTASKQQDTSPAPDKVAVPSTQPTSQVVPNKGNRVERAILKFDKINESMDSTLAQRQAAHAILRGEISAVPTVLNYEVADITIRDDTTAWLHMSKTEETGIMTCNYPNYRHDDKARILISISQVDAQKIQKGSAFTITGTLDTYDTERDPSHLELKKYTPLGILVCNGHKMVIDKKKGYPIGVAIQKGFFVTLNGRRLEGVTTPT